MGFDRAIDKHLHGHGWRLLPRADVKPGFMNHVYRPRYVPIDPEEDAVMNTTSNAFLASASSNVLSSASMP